MEWWQILLISLASVVAGMFLGALFHYLFERFAKKRETILVIELLKQFVKKRETTAVTELPEQFVKEPETTSVTELPEQPAKERETTSVTELPEQFVKEPETTVVFQEQLIQEQVQAAPPDLVAEAENNHKIATEPWRGNLLPFQTNTWDTLQDKLGTLPMNLQDDLAQIYIDIRLANSIVRMSTEFNHRSRNLDETYVKLRTSIAERLNNIKPQLLA